MDTQIGGNAWQGHKKAQKKKKKAQQSVDQTTTGFYNS